MGTINRRKLLQYTGAAGVVLGALSGSRLSYAATGTLRIFSEDTDQPEIAW